MSETIHKFETKVGEFGPTVHAETGKVIFLGAMWGGRDQEIPVDPSDVDELIGVLREARSVSGGEAEGK